MDLTQLTVTELRDGVAGRKFSAQEAARAFLDRIAARDGTIHAFNEVLADEAMLAARAVDEGKVTGPLAGVPIGIKDNICTTIGHTTCSSRMLKNFRAPYDATVIKRLKAAGAVMLGKLNMDEFAMGSSTENSSTGVTRNPWALDYVPGGSSGGSAAAVAAGFCPASLGSDTGGSIRQPAALCGLVGIKPTYGMVSRYGLVAFASSLDQIGPLARNVRDAATILDAIAGPDGLDSTSAPLDFYSASQGAGRDLLGKLDEPIKGLKLGIARQYLSDANGPAMRQAMEKAIAQFTSMGATIVEVDLPHTEYGIPVYYLVATAEASSNLARYDGVHYGHRTATPEDLIDLYAASRAEGFGDEVKRRIMLGTYALSSGYYDAYYLRALKVRRLIRQDFDRAFEKCDALIGPTTTGPAFKIGEKSSDPLQMYLNDVYTVNCNLAGIPGLSICCGFDESTVDRHPLPLGMQIFGPNFSEAKLLRIARMFEAANNHHHRRPSI